MNHGMISDIIGLIMDIHVGVLLLYFLNYYCCYSNLNDLFLTVKLVKQSLVDSHILTGNAVDNGHYKFRQLHLHWVIIS